MAFYSGQGNLWQTGFPQLYGAMYGRMGTEEESRLRDLMGYNIGQLGGALGSQMSRTNVPIAGGWDMLARRFLAPMQTQMQAQQMPWEQKVMTTLGMAEKFWPMFQTRIQAGDYWKQVMNKFMKELFGGK